MKKINSIDSLIEKLAIRFVNTKDFEKLQESAEGQKMFDFLVKSISDMETFESLFLNYYIPASNKSIADSWRQISESKYKHLLNIKKEELKENLYETIRLGYVGLFHKYESYLKALIVATDFLMTDVNLENNLLNIKKYCQKEYGINIHLSHNHFSITNRINYISNCVKHYDGLPIKEPIHKDFKNHDKTEKIKIDPRIFKTDIDRLKIHCELMLTQLITMAFKQYLDLDYETIQKSLKPGLKSKLGTKDKIEEIKKNFDLVLSDFRN